MSLIADFSATYSLRPDPGRLSDSPSGKNLEVEVKFLVNSHSPVRKRLLSLGAAIKAPRVYEVNVRFDTPDEAMTRRQELLRLRQDRSAWLTYKGRSESDLTSEAKVREEIEVEVDDFGRMSMILGRLGLVPVQTYEKYRETFHWNDVEIVLDELPFGNFIELEGDEEGLKAAAAALGLNWSDRILANYLALMSLARQSFDLPFSDLTFDNFRDNPVDMAGILPLCRFEADV